MISSEGIELYHAVSHDEKCVAGEEKTRPGLDHAVTSERLRSSGKNTDVQDRNSQNRSMEENYTSIHVPNSRNSPENIQSSLGPQINPILDSRPNRSSTQCSSENPEITNELPNSFPSGLIDDHIGEADVSKKTSTLLQPTLVQCIFLCQQVIQELIVEGDQKVVNVSLPSKVALVRKNKDCAEPSLPVVSTRSFDAALSWDLSFQRMRRDASVSLAQSYFPYAFAPTKHETEGVFNSEQFPDAGSKASYKSVILPDGDIHNARRPDHLDKTAVSQCKSCEFRQNYDNTILLLQARLPGPEALREELAIITQASRTSPPTKTISFLLITLHEKLDLADDTVMIFLAALVYLVRLAARSTSDCTRVTNRNWYRLTVVSLLLATKMYREGSRSTSMNQFFSRAARIPINELRNLELDLLYLLDFDLIVTERDVKGWVDWIRAGSPAPCSHLQSETRTLQQSTLAADGIGQSLCFLPPPTKKTGISLVSGEVMHTSEAGISYTRSTVSMFSNVLSNATEYEKPSLLNAKISFNPIDDVSLISDGACAWESRREISPSDQQELGQLQKKESFFLMANPTHSPSLNISTVSLKKEPRLFNTVNAPEKPATPLSLCELSRLFEKRHNGVTCSSLEPISPGSFFKRSSTSYQKHHSRSQASFLSQRKAFSSAGKQSGDLASRRSYNPSTKSQSCGSVEKGVGTATYTFREQSQEPQVGSFGRNPLGDADWESTQMGPSRLSGARDQREASCIETTPINKKSNLKSLQSGLKKGFMESTTRKVFIAPWKDRHTLVRNARQFFNLFSSLVSGKLDIMGTSQDLKRHHGITDEAVLLSDDNDEHDNSVKDSNNCPTSSFATSCLSHKTKKSSVDKVVSLSEASEAKIVGARRGLSAPPFKHSGTRTEAVNIGHRITPTDLDRTAPDQILTDADMLKTSNREETSWPELCETRTNTQSNWAAVDSKAKASKYFLNKSAERIDLGDCNDTNEVKEDFYDEYYDVDGYYDSEGEYWDEEDEKIELCRPPPRMHSPPLL